MIHYWKHGDATRAISKLSSQHYPLERKVPKGRVMLAAAMIAIVVVSAAGCGGGGGPAPILPATRPLKHLIVVVGANRSVANVFAPYQPPDPAQHALHLRSDSITDAS